MIGPVRSVVPISRPQPRASAAGDAYARLDRAAAERERMVARRAAEARGVEWRVRELGDGTRLSVRRWTHDAGDGQGERTVHIDAFVE